MKQFTVIYNEKNPRIAQIALQIIKNLKAQKFILKINDFKNSDFVVVLGGDGTVLKAVAMMSENNNKLLPILPVSLGRLGFLAEIHPHHLVPTLKRIMQQQKFILDKRALLDVYLRGSSGTGKNKKELLLGRVLNDVVLAKLNLLRVLDIDIHINRQNLLYRADGIILSTPTGSTAYNLSAGGPIIDSHKKNFLLTPICPHLLKWKTKVLNSKQVVRASAKPSLGQKVAVVLDGQKQIELKNHQTIVVKISKNQLSFIRLKPFSQAATIKQKFHS
jgi:NAD+ kinase